MDHLRNTAAMYPWGPLNGLDVIDIARRILNSQRTSQRRAGPGLDSRPQFSMSEQQWQRPGEPTSCQARRQGDTNG